MLFKPKMTRVSQVFCILTNYFILLRSFDAGPDETVDLDCDADEMVTVLAECDALLMSDWLKPCRDEVDISQTYGDCKVDYCMDPSDDTKKDILERLV